MVKVKPFRLGVVEGFFGKSWSWESRTQYAQFLSGNGFTTYLYAPKNDDYFRKLWKEPCPTSHLDALTRLATHYKGAGIEFAIGLSPFELYKDFSSAGQDALSRKLEEINTINPDILCILFDDMPGAVDNLADEQLKIMDFVTRHSKARDYIFCPTYYSNDPLLETHFGKRPEKYLEELGGQLDSRIDIFWTGPNVFTSEFTEDHLHEITGKLSRKPLLWDNYPVNDSKTLAGNLHFAPFMNRSPELKNLTQGHMANPMNQASLSQIALYSLGKLYQEDGFNSETILEEAFNTLCPPKISALLLEDSIHFQNKGLENFSAEDIKMLMTRYSPFQEHPMVSELLDWLNGDYAFDPQCLT
jgi:hyaluronoglucosaminidase